MQKYDDIEKIRRAKAVASANASLRLEGMKVDAEVEAINKRFINCEITSEQQISLVKKLYIVS